MRVARRGGDRGAQSLLLLFHRVIVLRQDHIQAPVIAFRQFIEVRPRRPVLRKERCDRDIDAFRSRRPEFE